MTTGLTAAERAQLAQRLAAQRSALDARRQARLEGHTRAEHAHEVLLQDNDDAPQRDNDREIDLAMTDLDIVQLSSIDDALQRLADGSYGKCRDCGENIPLARLELEPQTTNCIACAVRHERGRPRAASL